MFTRFISQLAHVELVSPKAAETLAFMTGVMGLEQSAQEGSSVYLRGWGDHFHHSVVVTEGEAPALAHVAWRAQGPEALEEAASRLEASGLGEGWVDATTGHGPAYRYRGPGGHVHEIFWEVERWQAPAELAPIFPNRPQRFVPRGVAARHLDHVTVATRDILGDVAWYRDTLGYRFMEWTCLDENEDVVVFAMVTTNEKSHDLGLVGDHSGIPGRLHHVAFWLDEREQLLRAADVLLDAGVQLEYGPGRHGMGEQTFLYFREPGGLRLELNSGGYRNYQPDWQPVLFKPAQGSNDFYRNRPLPEAMLESFPPDGSDAHEGAVNPWAAASVS
jgi:catechol 2,3-dioxygenase